jgi:hypothetical protein
VPTTTIDTVAAMVDYITRPRGGLIDLVRGLPSVYSSFHTSAGVMLMLQAGCPVVSWGEVAEHHHRRCRGHGCLCDPRKMRSDRPCQRPPEPRQQCSHLDQGVVDAIEKVPCANGVVLLPAAASTGRAHPQSHMLATLHAYATDGGPKVEQRRTALAQAEGLWTPTRLSQQLIPFHPWARLRSAYTTHAHARAAAVSTPQSLVASWAQHARGVHGPREPIEPGICAGAV